MSLAIETMRARQADALKLEDSGERKASMDWALKGESRRRLESLLSIAQTQPGIASAAGDNWNHDPYLLGVQNGVIDLRTGTLRDGRPADRITQTSPVVFDRQAECPVWESTLMEVFDNDKAQVNYMQRALGYSLTGSTQEECFFLCRGGGGAGVGTVLNTVGRILGDYTDTLLFKSLERHDSGTARNDLAKIVGKRFVTVPESNQSIRMDEGLLKRLTGRDEVTARFLYGEFFTFTPQSKFWLMTNHPPTFEDTSRGIARRCRTIIFPRIFEGQQVDMTRKDALHREASGILRWLVEGALLWQQHGLTPPKETIQASQQLRSERDAVKRFLRDQTIAKADSTLSASEMYTAFTVWSESQGVELLPLKQFGIAVQMAYERFHTRKGNRYAGVAWRSVKGEGRIPNSSSISSSRGSKRKDPSHPSRFAEEHAFINVDHEPPLDDGFIPEPTLKEQWELVKWQAEQYEREQLQATAWDWDMTPAQIRELLAEDGCGWAWQV